MLDRRSLAFVALLSFSTYACSSSSSGPSAATPDGATTGDDAGNDAGGDGAPAVVHATPPAPPAMMAGDGSGSVTFAISKLYLGDVDRDGTPDRSDGWKAYGYDLDGKVSTTASTDLCKPIAGAQAKNVYPDGNDGIDNAYGKLILPITLGIASDAPTKANDAIAAGKGTTLIDIQKLGSGNDYAPLVAAVFDGADLGAPAKFDGTDAWPVTAESVDGSTSSPKQSFAMSYLADGTWVSGAFGDLQLTLPLFAGAAPVTLHHAVITMKLDGAHKNATFGTIAGVISTADLVAAIRKLAGAIDATLCSGPTIDSIVSQIQQASDILSDGTQDPNKSCDGISIGLGFDAAIVQLGPVAAPVPAPTNPCP